MRQFRYDPFAEPPETFAEAERQLYYFQLLGQSLEHTITNTSPFDEQYEMLVDRLFQVRDAIREAGLQRVQLYYREAVTPIAPY